jgi:putative mRNA 3-end processing factor
VVIAPSAVGDGPAFRSIGPASTANASGWMAVRGNKRRLALDRGFVLSDHADWTELNEAIAATGAERVFVTHGQIDPFVRWLREKGLDARPVPTDFSSNPLAAERDEIS